ncbi:MAG: DUF2080 family transposase-associated protein [Candidatus Hodarchaeota archaeon]
MKSNELENETNYKIKRKKRRNQCKIITYGFEAFEIEITKTSSSGRVDLPSSWIGKRVKIIRIN